MSSWLWLFLAILAEVVGTTALKLSEGFTRWLPILLLILGYGFAMYAMSQSLRDLSLSLVYAVWSAAGIGLITLVGFFFFSEDFSLLQGLSLLLILLGIIGLRWEQAA